MEISEAEQNALILKYRPLARKIAREEYEKRGNGFDWRGFDFGDLIGEANLALVLAARRYDPNKGEFAPYAASWIKGEIRKFLSKQPEMQEGITIVSFDEERDSGCGYLERSYGGSIEDDYSEESFP